MIVIRNFLAILLSFAATFLFCLLLIPLLRKLKAGQNILSYVKEHESKGGTPTMGGLAFVGGASLVCVILAKEVNRSLLLALAVGLAFTAVGFWDDYLKRRRKQNLGLKAWQKLLFQGGIALFVSVYCLRAEKTELYIPFFGERVEVGWGIIPIAFFVFLATVNAVNLTDGLDGLAAGVSLPFFGCLGVIILLQGSGGTLATLCFCLTGALLAYLLFNCPPASVFMGDTGSLGLGGFAAALALFSGNALFIPLLGVCFVFSVISVIMQVIYYKVTGGKRIFLMSPAHHHFQQKGYSESKISYAYFVVTLLIGLLCVGGVYVL